MEIDYKSHDTIPLQKLTQIRKTIYVSVQTKKTDPHLKLNNNLIDKLILKSHFDLLYMSQLSPWSLSKKKLSPWSYKPFFFQSDDCIYFNK